MKNILHGREYLFSDAKYLKLDIEVPHIKIAKEVASLRDKFIAYRSSDSRGWYSLPIIGKSSTEPNSWQSYFSSAEEAMPYMVWTDICNKCPTTVEWLKNRYPSIMYARVRFMLLEVGGYINFHKDTEHMVIGAINVAITNPIGCAWHWRDGKSLEFKPGDVYAMNIGHEHSVRNDGNEDRYHIIVHHYDSTKQWKIMMQKSMKKYKISGCFRYSNDLF